MGLLTDGEGGEGKKLPPRPKICDTYSTIMKLGTVIPREDIWIYESRDTPLCFADISTYFTGNQQILQYKKYRYRLHFESSKFVYAYAYAYLFFVLIWRVIALYNNYTVQLKPNYNI